MRKLTDCHLYDILDKTTKFSDELKKINLKEEIITMDDIDENIRIINRRFAYSMKSKVLIDLEMGKILMIYPENNKLTKLIPTFVSGKSNDYTAIVNLRLYGNIDRKGNFNIDNRTLFHQLQSGTITRELHENWNKVAFNIKILKLSTLIYVKMFNKVLDRMYGINLMPIRSDQINYAIGCFFLRYVIGKDKNDKNIENIAMNTIFNDTRKEVAISVGNEFSPDSYDSLDKFIKELSTVEGLGKLNLRIFLDNWMSMFGESSLMAIEYYPALLDNIFAAMISARINKEFIFENLVGDETLDLYSELSRIFR